MKEYDSRFYIAFYLNNFKESKFKNICLFTLQLTLTERKYTHFSLSNLNVCGDQLESRTLDKD